MAALDLDEPELGQALPGLEDLGLVEIDHDAETGVRLTTTPMGATLADSMRL